MAAATLDVAWAGWTGAGLGWAAMSNEPTSQRAWPIATDKPTRRNNCLTHPIGQPQVSKEHPERGEALTRYRQKRKTRHFEKTIRYASRQVGGWEEEAPAAVACSGRALQVLAGGAGCCGTAAGGILLGLQGS